jgi:hypothetical protein
MAIRRLGNSNPSTRKKFDYPRVDHCRELKAIHIIVLWKSIMSKAAMLVTNS